MSWTFDLQKVALKTREITLGELISGGFYPFETTVRLQCAAGRPTTLIDGRK